MERKRAEGLLVIASVVPLGFALKYYSGSGHEWCNNYGAGVMYEVFWCLCAFTFFPKKKNIPYIVVAIFILTCTLECMQLWHPPMLETIRSYKAGVWLIGNDFDWLDFPHYAIGCGIGWLILRLLDSRLTSNIQRPR